MSFTLKPGKYIITSVLSNNGIGRYSREDMSLLPKNIYHLTSDQKPAVWDVNMSGDGYILTANGPGRSGHAACIDDKLFAVLLDFPAPDRWRIIPSGSDGPGCYVIAQTTGRSGWVVEGNADDLTQIVLKPLLMTPSEPPHYPPFQVFKFTRVDRA
ncbi:hypothetical protein EUX98_g5439 [Antrodiella citrinella]|uniref:Ricin B lectin domain-containing protein n=1 Tax=Antrodiella citrinella TaxID=2447956 RepID=A0A4S4MSD3_9APHY|nr:hypothetical protein EUX98_g5439 [Antrodiella citrinella]